MCQHLRSSSDHVRDIRLVAGGVKDREMLFLCFEVSSTDLKAKRI